MVLVIWPIGRQVLADERRPPAFRCADEGDDPEFGTSRRSYRRQPLSRLCYRIVITSPLRSAATINPTWRPETVSNAPF
jgi:hypothetical protein